jgi:serine/threonine-protein phosphatase 2A regulatory subunit B
MNRNSTTSSRWRSRRRSIRSNGSSGRMPLTFCYQQTVGWVIGDQPLSRNLQASSPVDKTIKLWKVFEKSLKVVTENNHHDAQQQPISPPHQRSSLRLPRMQNQDNIVAAVPRKVYANAHAYHINSISINSDGETYISADDLRVNLWNLNISDQSFSPYRNRIFCILDIRLTIAITRFLDIVDIKPVNMEELTEVITAAEFHPIQCNTFMYSSSKGTIKLADMRDSALCDRHAKRK